jgi:integrase
VAASPRQRSLLFRDNRAIVEKQAAVIGAEIRAGIFDYLAWFPNGNRAKDFAPGRQGSQSDSVKKITIGEYYGFWIRGKVPPDVRASLARDYASHFRNYILDKMGNVPLSELSLAHLEDLRRSLRSRKLAEKTIRNVVDGSFRAMIRDAGRHEIPATFPFPKLTWRNRVVPGPSPLSREERDQVLRFFRDKRWKVGGFNNAVPHYPYFAFLYTLFYTGMRPSELCAVPFRNVNLRLGTIQVDRSRHL